MPESSPEFTPEDVFRQRALEAIKGTPMSFDEAALVIIDAAGDAMVR